MITTILNARKSACIRAMFVATIIVSAGCIGRAPTEPPYLILYAFEAEGALLAEQMMIRDSAVFLGRTVYIGSLSGKEVVLAESGVGTNNAAMTTQQLLDNYDPRAVVFTGIAGAIDTAVRIGDIVVCSTWFQYDYGYHGKDGFQPTGQEIYDPVKDSITWTAAYRADSGLFARAAGLTRSGLDLELIGDRKPSIIVGGIGVTGNAFIDSPEKRIWLNETFGAFITDMESSAVAHVCTANDVPFIVIRSASDLAGGSGSETAGAELEQFFEVAADNSSRVVMRYLPEL